MRRSISGVSSTNTGSDYGGTNMGTGCATNPAEFNNYSQFFETVQGAYPQSTYMFQTQFS
jgi:hypothetical protein